jgi:2-hydroxychromene-2-carboxylate isomerase
VNEADVHGGAGAKHAMAAPTLVFWYEFASTYSYPAALCIESTAAAASVEVAWRPFLLGPVFASQGLTDSPFNVYEAKGRYMWRDLERLCARDGIPWRRPSTFPRNGLLAARVAIVAMGEGWGPAFSKAAFHANFAEDRDIAAPATLADILGALGQDPAPVLERAQTQRIKDALRVQTAEAQRLGIFGAPMFQVGAEMFWGQDRLADALAWAQAASA